MRIRQWLEYRYRHRNLGAIVPASPYKIMYSYVYSRPLLAYGNINLYIIIKIYRYSRHCVY